MIMTLSGDSKGCGEYVGVQSPLKTGVGEVGGIEFHEKEHQCLN